MPCVKAALTVTFALPKIGLMVYPGAEYVGELVVADIGMPREVMAADDVKVFATEASDVTRWLPARVNGRDSNKGKFGHVTVFAGSAGFAGAPALSAEAAARTGAGLVTLAVPAGIQNALMARVSPVVMTKGLPETSEGTFGVDAVDAALKLAAKGTSAALGPGLGGAENSGLRAFVREFISRCPVPLVIDADALNCLAKEHGHGASLVKSRPAATVLTPHPGEMGRAAGNRHKGRAGRPPRGGGACSAELWLHGIIKRCTDTNRIVRWAFSCQYDKQPRHGDRRLRGCSDWSPGRAARL